MKLIATSKLGLESTVSHQLGRLGIRVEKTEDARILFSGDERDMVRSLLWLRTAERVLLEVGTFPALTFDELFEGTKRLPWKQYLPKNARIHVTGKSAKSALFSVSDCQSIVKKAIVENLKAAYRTDTIPETGEEIIVEVGLLRDTATLALDCCGAGLSRRGYRTYNVAAPISETLGAAIVLLSRYRAGQPFADPMCGSGTLPIEAAMIVQNIAPGLRRRFAAEAWSFVTPDIWSQAREEAEDAKTQSVDLPIFGSDIDERCIDLCKKHAKKAGVMLHWSVQPVSAFSTDLSGGLLACNPPYGERLMDHKSAAALYRQMHDVFSCYRDWGVSIITGFPDFERIYGARADKRRKLSNGGMTCQLYQYFGERKQ